MLLLLRVDPRAIVLDGESLDDAAQLYHPQASQAPSAAAHAPRLPCLSTWHPPETQGPPTHLCHALRPTPPSVLTSSTEPVNPPSAMPPQQEREPARFCFPPSYQRSHSCSPSAFPLPLLP